MNKTLLILICALTIIVVGVCFLCGGTLARAEVADIIVVHYGSSSWSYSRSYGGLDSIQRVSRGVGLGADVQYNIAQQLIHEGYTKLQAYNYVLPRFASFVDKLDSVQVDRADATVDFDPNSSSKFVYHSGSDGVSVDIDKLAYMLLESQHGNSITLPIIIDNATTVDYLRANTAVRATFSTSYSNRPNRVANILRASQLISGSVVGVGQRWSFNDVVGERTLDNGFCPSTVIVEGVYGDGIGGGVCQVSTTLYNALLLADLSITAVCQHTLVPGYIQPSFDAMVSYPYADLCFTNNTDMPIYVECTANSSSVAVTIYGSATKVRVVRRSEVLDRQPYDTLYITDSQLYPHLLYTSDTQQIVSGSDGVVSIGYIDRYIGDTLLSSSSGRRCTYAKVDRVVAQGSLPLCDIDQQSIIEQGQDR